MRETSVLRLAAEVRQALSDGSPVVALETSILSHGMPFPENLQTARSAEEIIRSEGAIPATIGIVDGCIKVGLSPSELERFACPADIVKVSVRDLPWVVATKKNGATTVAATLFCARLAGISVFVTGGIGGVHRQADRTMDVSADLAELARSNVAVVCAGAKSVLDQAKTLEYLETLGVPVVGYGTNDFPSFYARNSGLPVSSRVDTPAQAAGLMRAKWEELKLPGGIVFANPIPEADALDSAMLERALDQAVGEAEERKISGKEVTPFLLSRLSQLTSGTSLKANISLVCHNARVGARVANAFAEPA